MDQEEHTAIHQAEAMGRALKRVIVAYEDLSKPSARPSAREELTHAVLAARETLQRNRPGASVETQLRLVGCCIDWYTGADRTDVEAALLPALRTAIAELGPLAPDEWTVVLEKDTAAITKAEVKW